MLILTEPTEPSKHQTDYNLSPNVKLYSKLEIMKMFPKHITEKYYSVYDGKEYTAFVENAELVAKQYPKKNGYYLI